ncbi:MAG: immunoglobulin domain-containing protein [Verrucomicrobia bacterium]|nr:immunoglobulin domain-containing protein [Verrucomicrobiota bacterium]
MFHPLKFFIALALAAPLLCPGEARAAALNGPYSVVESYTIIVTYGAEASRVYQASLTNTFQMTNSKWTAINLTTAAVPSGDLARTLVNSAGHYNVQAGNEFDYFQGSNAPIAAAIPIGFYFVAIPFDGNTNDYQWTHPGLLTITGTAVTNLSGTSTYSHGYDFANALPDVLLVVSSKVSIVSAATPPNVTSMSPGLATNGGGSVTMTVVATGAAPLTYQWFKDAAVVTNATNASLTLTNLHRADSGAYTVTITNAGGGTNAGPAQLTVRVPQRLVPQLVSGSTVRVQFGDADGVPFPPGFAGSNFQVQATTNVTATNWPPLTNTLTLTNGVLSIDDGPPLSARRFYRVNEN